MRVLVTGGAGFVGSHTIDLLIARGHDVVALDSLDPQVHGANGSPANIESHITAGSLQFVRGDVRNRNIVGGLLKEADALIHLAAAVGVGQSMYMPHHYVDTNISGTAAIADVLANDKTPIKRIVVASSMSIYGEGAYRCHGCGSTAPSDRTEEQLRHGRWEHQCARCQETLVPVPTPETKPLNCSSVYALSKKTQEEMLLIIGKAYGIPVTALRYFNIYGPRQSLNNPYTGVAAIFLSRLQNESSPHVFEDGRQSRDFINVRDVALANVLALEAADAQRVYNVGTGKPITVLEVAGLLQRGLQSKAKPTLANSYRAGDIRHCFADCSRIERDLGFRPQVPIETGFQELIAWSRAQRSTDNFATSLEELKVRRLVL
jgi:dTDP-L-rhamnose 4-epimerase